MLIEELIQLGRPILESGLDPREVLRLITDAADDRVKNFYRHVIVVELPLEEAAGEPAVLPIQNWQVELQAKDKNKPEIDVDVERALGVPMSLPAGGNPLNPQGVYGLPVYPVYNRHFKAFRDSTDGVRKYLTGRLDRTPSTAIDPPLLNRIAEQLHAIVAERYDGSEKWLGVLVLADCGPGGFFSYREADTRTRIGRSVLRKGRYIEPIHARIAEALWTARLEEGAGMGRREGSCSITGEGEQAVAAYCKAWPWAFPTWTCPLPHGGDTDLLVEGIALSERSYRALTLGANIFHRLTRKLHRVVLPELFAPVENRDRQNAARSRSKLPEIFGSAFLLPLRDTALAESFDRDSFAQRVLAILDAPAPPEPLADRYLTAVTGFDVFLPEELNRDQFRLTLVYFSGDVSRGDVHLRAYIQDVLPSTAGDLKRAVRPCREQMDELMRLLSPNISDKHRAYLAICYQSVPYLVARGYGGSYLWSVLEQCLHRRPLDDRAIIAHVAARIRSVVPRWPESRFEVIDEIVFLLACRNFLHRYNREVAKPPKEDFMPMREWRKLLEMLEKRPPTDMSFQKEGVAELGFACGAIIRRFSRWYWRATKAGSEGKDYLKHRVLTFGTDLSPEAVWRIGLGKLCDVAARYEIKVGRTFRERLGIVLTELEQRKKDLKSSRDEFMTAFWAGYCLQGYDRPTKPKAVVAFAKGGEK